MSGLVSKWATDSALVDQAVHQDDNSKQSSPKDKWSKPITSNKSSPLVSKWASAADDTDLTPIDSDHSKHKPRRGKQHEPAAAASTPPASAEGNARRSGKHDRHRRRSKDGAKSAGDHHHETLPPMTDAAKAFAARLGTPETPRGARGARSPLTPPASRGKQDTLADSPEIERAPVSLEGNPLAARLGVVPDRTRAKGARGSKLKSPAHPRDRPSRKTERSGARAPPPERPSEPGPEELKAEEELRELLDKLDAKELDWASFE